MIIGRYHISQFFKSYHLENLQRWYHTSRGWEDGVKSLTWSGTEDPKKVKNTLQNYPKGEMLWPSIDSNNEFIQFTGAETTTAPMATKTPVGGYYKPHFDDVTNGHFSTTIFINDPNEYEGGELGLWIDGKEELFKLEPGWGITYETGIGHNVRPVTKGERHVLVMWTHSTWPNIDDFRDWKYWDHMVERLWDPNHQILQTLEDHVNDPYSFFRQKANKIRQKYIKKTEK